MTGELKHNRWLTSGEFLVHELHMQVEHLLLGFTLQQLQLLPPTHHVTQVPHLHNEEKDKSNTVHWKQVQHHMFVKLFPAPCCFQEHNDLTIHARRLFVINVACTASRQAIALMDFHRWLFTFSDTCQQKGAVLIFFEYTLRVSGKYKTHAELKQSIHRSTES